MASPDRSSPACDALQKTLKVSRKQSWLGSIRQAVAQSALTAKAAVDNLRERIEGPDAKNDHAASPDKESGSNHASQGSQRPRLRHQRTLTPKTALTSIRSHLPIRSTDSKHHSLSELFRRRDSRELGIQGPETFYRTPSRKDLASTASLVPLPSSPVDIPDPGPCLALDIDTSAFLSPTAVFAQQACAEETRRLQDPANITTGKPASLSKLHVLSNSASPLSRRDSILPDPLQPIAEARRCPDFEIDKELFAPLESSVSFIVGSPLSGTTASMEIEAHVEDIAEILEPHADAESELLLRKAQSLDAIAATDTEDCDSIALPSPLLQETVRRHLQPADQSHTLAPSLAATPTRVSSRKSSGHKNEASSAFGSPSSMHSLGHILQAMGMPEPPEDNVLQHKAPKENVLPNGPPSPDRSIKLPFRIRSKSGGSGHSGPILSSAASKRSVSQEPCAHHDPADHAKYSPILPAQSERIVASRRKEAWSSSSDEAVLTVAILRERTHDLSYLLDGDPLPLLGDNSTSSSLESVAGTPVALRVSAHMHALASPTGSTPGSGHVRQSPSPRVNRTPSMGDRVQFDLARSERNARYNALYGTSCASHSSSSPDAKHTRFGRHDTSSPESKSSSPNRSAQHGTSVTHNRFALLTDLDESDSDQEC